MDPHAPWKISLHGGHSGEFCDHAQGTLRDMLDAAAAYGYAVFGVTEHMPRLGAQYLYAEERARGWDVAKIEADFARYATVLPELAKEYEGKLHILRGFEAEVVPPDCYVDIVQGYRDRYAFDYIVGSVHHVDGHLIDGPMDEFEAAVKACGGLEPLAVRYYETVTAMVGALQPEVVGHLDLIQKNAGPDAHLDTPPIRRAAMRALDAISACGAILDVNTAGYRKGLGRPYPAEWIVEAGRDMGIGFCFGDDSHAPGQVGAGLLDARAYLVALGVKELTYLTRTGQGNVKETISLHLPGPTGG